ncbi:MAG: hypothetical protein EPO20_15515 [Betaproteobacteria bacterium]|nr:MAG: hypothetical protein EPO20_15515 [Betaproteobacteria bacterium]
MLDLSRQQRNLLLLRPLFQLELSKNKFEGALDGEGNLFDGIDTHYLVLATLDYMMEGTTVALGFTQSEILGYVARVVGAMKPALSDAQRRRVAEIVLDTLDNKARNYQEFAFDYFDAKRLEVRPVKFRLVVYEPDLEDVYRYRPTPYGYLVYLGMLDLSPEDSQELMEKMLQLLVERGRFDAALEIARRARTLSIEYRQIIRDHLTSAIRAPGSVNWTRDLEPRLSYAREHVAKRQEEDRRMDESVRDALIRANELKTRESLVTLLKAIRDAGLNRTHLVSDITLAAERFSQAQTAVFRARRPSNLPDLEARVLPDLLRARTALLAEEADPAIAALYPPAMPRVYELNTVFALLLDRRPEDTALEDVPPEIVRFEPLAEQFPEALIHFVQEWLSNKFAIAEGYHVDELLQLAQDEGFGPVHQRCLALMLFRCFAKAETLFPNVSASADGYFRSEVARGTNLKFDKRESV